MRSILMRCYALLLVTLASADVYMHSPRGSNDRNCEKNTNRNNGNRLFDSQNNAKGGYACPRPRVGPDVKVDKMYYYTGSKVVVEWTNQHGCGTNPKTSCEVVIQYACEDTLDPTKKFAGNLKEHIGAPRDGTPRSVEDAATDTVPDDADKVKADTQQNRRYGMHENYDYYQKCKQRLRNQGLYTADQNVRNNRGATRQNPNGNRRGFECAEERDYYPYWMPSPWRDIAVITSNPQRCPYYKAESNNVKARGECVPLSEYYGTTAVHRSWCPSWVLGSSQTPDQLKTAEKWWGSKPECEARGHKWAPVWWDAVHPDSVKAVVAQKVAEKTQDSSGGFTHQILANLPFEATCQMNGATPSSQTLTLDKTTLYADRRYKTVIDSGKAKLPKRGKVSTVEKFARPVVIEMEIDTDGGQDAANYNIDIGNPTSWNMNGYRFSVNFGAATNPYLLHNMGTAQGRYNNFVKQTGPWTNVKVTIEMLADGTNRFSFSGDGGAAQVIEFKDKTVQAGRVTIENPNKPITLKSIKVQRMVGITAEQCKAALANIVTDPNAKEIVFSAPATGRVQSCGDAEDMGFTQGYLRTLLGYGDVCGCPRGYGFPSGNLGTCLASTGKQSSYNDNAKNNFGCENTNLFKTSGIFMGKTEGAYTFMIPKQAGMKLWVKVGGAWTLAAENADIMAPVAYMNSRQDCWEPCMRKSGNCTGFCGLGKCCRKNYKKGENGCAVTEGGDNRHECVQPAKGYEAQTGFAYHGLHNPALWTKTKPLTGRKFELIATSPAKGSAGTARTIRIGVQLPDGTVDAPMKTMHAAYKVCTTGDCKESTNLQAPQLKATASCECASWKDVKPEWSIKGEGCMQPPLDRKDAPWCYCKPSSTTPQFKDINAKSLTWSDKTMFTSNTKELPGFHGPFTVDSGPVFTTVTKLPSHGMVKVTGRFYAINSWDSEQAMILLDDVVGLRIRYRMGKTCTAYESLTTGFKPFTGNATGLTAVYTASGAPIWKDYATVCYYDFEITMAHTAASLTLKLATELNEVARKGWSNDESWGFQNVRIQTSTSTQVKQEDYTRKEAQDNSGYDLFSMRVGDGGEDIKHSTPLTESDCNAACSNQPGCLQWVFKTSDFRCWLKSARSVSTTAKDGYISGFPHGPTAPQWSYCSPTAATGSSSRRLLAAASTRDTAHTGANLGMHEMSKGEWMRDEEMMLADTEARAGMHQMPGGSWMKDSDMPAEEEEQWLEDHIAASAKVSAASASEAQAALDQGASPQVGEPVDCVDGRFSTSRENHLGNARNTANPDPAIPHGINANRYIWTVPDHVQGSCVLRLRYNISTSDYWAWNNKGTPKTNSALNANRRRVKGSSPLVQDPYVGIGTNHKETFLQLAINTNQFGRTFQDRSYVFEIKKRPKEVTADKKIYNVNVRGKRGNIVQVYPAVEYDFIPNDLCVNKDDYVHFQWTGSDYNPKNDGEGAGDSPPGDPNQQSRADRSNVVDMDTIPAGLAHPEDRPEGVRSGAQNGAGQHSAEVASGMYHFAGAVNHWRNMDQEYSGMFWTKDNKPDKDAIMKMAFLNQAQTLAKKGERCKTVPELLKIGNENARDRDSNNCAKLNAAADSTGQRTPYFDGGLTQMRKGGRFSYMSSRNNNFSNRNQAGFMCVKQGQKGTCSAGKTCEDMVEDELLAKQTSETPSGGTKKLELASTQESDAVDAKVQAALQDFLKVVPADKVNEVIKAYLSQN